MLNPLEDFLIQCNSGSINGKYKLFWAMDTVKKDSRLDKKLKKRNLSDKFIVTIPANKQLRQPSYGAKGVIFVQEKNLEWFISWGFKVDNYCVLDIHLDKIPKKTKEISLDIENKFYAHYKTNNIIGYVEGSKFPDSFYVFCAHYDHLGAIGDKYYFPGANDNASGTSMVMDLAKHFSKKENQPKYSIAFMLFSGEEAGLHGSFYYNDNPYFPLSNIKLVINLDMVGSGSDGITLVNSTEVPWVYKRFQKINIEKDYLKSIHKRGASANSDHFPFTEKDVPAIFIYTKGSECANYHNIYDKHENMPFTEYEDLFKLLLDFVR
ncbi:MAG: aminopeptidase [Bacteroidetes bacterium HGW-Bacteroidetes-12]|nr:MAG: aminopeptidase [Bacteroidetes bacterium HGW-Bacteroidetes-12]